MASLPPIGRQLRHWRQVRGLSQLRLATRADISARHLGFVELGRSRPGREVVERLAVALDLPLRERNELLRAAGWPPSFPEDDIDGADLAPIRQMLRLLLAQQEPFPAFVLDRSWRLIDANQAAHRMFPQVGMLSPSELVGAFYGPGPMREAVLNWPEVAWAGLDRLRREAAEAGYPEQLSALVAEVEGWLADTPRPAPSSPLACPIFRFGDQTVRTMAAVARFGAAQHVALDELRVELIYPADEQARRFFESLASGRA